MGIKTNRQQVRDAIAAGGWVIVWGALIEEWQIIQLVVSIPTGTVALWVSQEVSRQVTKFGQSLGTVSDDVVKQATAFLTRLLKERKSGESEFNGIGVKAGIATYNRKYKTRFVSTKLPNHHQPYIGIRITKALPPKGFQLTDGLASEENEPVTENEPVEEEEEEWEEENEGEVVQGMTPTAIYEMKHGPVPSIADLEG